MRTLIDAGRASFFGGWRRRSIAELRGVAVTASYGLFLLLVSVSILFTVSVRGTAKEIDMGFSCIMLLRVSQGLDTIVTSGQPVPRGVYGLCGYHGQMDEDYLGQTNRVNLHEQRYAP
ncbi:hypothetical protein PC120_g21062 [Phytophthora cactorum]|nr:hypothetical protein PC120_g21062 [Phytophthora cactorum]